MTQEVPKGISTLEADLGQAMEFALPGAGTTGYRWELSAADGAEVKRLPVLPSPSFGGAMREIFQVTPRWQGNISLRWELRVPWQAEPAEVRIVELKVR